MLPILLASLVVATPPEPAPSPPEQPERPYGGIGGGGRLTVANLWLPRLDIHRRGVGVGGAAADTVIDNLEVTAAGFGFGFGGGVGAWRIDTGFAIGGGFASDARADGFLWMMLDVGTGVELWVGRTAIVFEPRARFYFLERTDPEMVTWSATVTDLGADVGVRWNPFGCAVVDTRVGAGAVPTRADTGWAVGGWVSLACDSRHR